MSLLELAETVIEVTGSRSEIVYERSRGRPQGAPARHLAGQRGARLGPEVELTEGLKRTIEEAGVERLVGA